MKTIRCAKCRKKLIKYQKIGKGRILKCYKVRIVENLCVLSKKEVKCPCGQIIGIDEGAFIRMKQTAFTSSGSISKK